MRLRDRSTLLAMVGLVLVGSTIPDPAEARSHHHAHHSHHARTFGGSGGYGEDYYTAASGHRVHRPVHSAGAPSGATARCGDTTWSFSENHRGTCSHHGGVSRWL